MKRSIKKILLTVLMILFSLSSIAAIDLGSSVDNVGFDGEFGYGVVPCFAEYQFWIKGLPQFVKGNTTSLVFKFKSGYVRRKDYETSTEYGSISGYIHARFTQGFKHNKYNGGDLYRLYAQFAIRMEQSMPTLIQVVDHDYTTFESLRKSSSDYTKGDIDFIDNLKEMANVFSIGIDFPWAIGKLIGTENYNFGARFDYSPRAVNNLLSSIFEIPIDFSQIYIYMDRYHTVYEKPQENRNNLNKLSLVLENSMYFRVLQGEYVPKNVGGTDFKYKFHDGYNFTVYGPHMKNRETYAYFRAGLNADFGCGSKTNRYNNTATWEFDSELYLLVHFKIFNIFHVQFKTDHEFFFINSQNETRFLQDVWEIPSFSFYISL